MKEIEGLVCVGRNEHVAVLYGKSINYEEPTYEAFDTNGLTPFDTPEQAQAAAREISSKKGFGFTDVIIGKIRLLLAENPDDVSQLKGEGGYIALMKTDFDDWLLIGAFVEGKSLRMSSPGSPLRTNGLTPFLNIDEAIEAAEQAARQSETSATIAAFEFEETENTLDSQRQIRLF